MKRGEMTEKQRIKTALMRHREQMRQNRYNREFATIYEGNKCIVCGNGFMTGIVCRKYRGNVCERHCPECEHFQPQFWHCTYQESEPIDVRKWRGVCTHHDKDTLAKFLHQTILYNSLLRSEGDDLGQEKVAQMYRRAENIVAARTSPKYAIAAAPDEYGNYSITDTDTGEILPLFAVYFKEYDTWTAVEYLPTDQ